MGVWPTNWVMSSATRRWDMVVALRTLQTMEVRCAASISLRCSGLLRQVRIRCRAILPSIVAALGAHGQPAVALGLGLHSNGAVPARGFGIGRLVPQCVLIADIVRHVSRDGIHFIQALGEKRKPSGLLRDELQRL